MEESKASQYKPQELSKISFIIQQRATISFSKTRTLEITIVDKNKKWLKDFLKLVKLGSIYTPPPMHACNPRRKLGYPFTTSSHSLTFTEYYFVYERTCGIIRTAQTSLDNLSAEYSFHIQRLLHHLSKFGLRTSGIRKNISLILKKGKD